MLQRPGAKLLALTASGLASQHTPDPAAAVPSAQSNSEQFSLSLSSEALSLGKVFVKSFLRSEEKADF